MCLKKLSFLIFLISVILTNNNSFSQPFSKEEREILKLQDTRTLGKNKKLLTYLNSDENKIKVRTLIALANIVDSTTTTAISDQLFKSKNKEVRKAAAFALGQIPSQTSIDYLLDAIKVEKNSFVKEEIYNSLGKIGDENALNYIVSSIPDKLDEKSYLAMAIARFAIRRIRNKNSVNALKKMLTENRNDLSLQRNAAYAFNRIADKDLLSVAESELIDLSKLNDSQVRIWAFGALGRLQNTVILIYELEFFSMSDWKVKVSKLNSLINFKPDSSRLNFKTNSSKALVIGASSGLLRYGIQDNNEHVSLTALNVYGKFFSDLKKVQTDELKELELEIKDELIKIANDKNLTWRQRSEAFNSAAMIFKDEIKNELLLAFSNTNDYNFKAGIIKAFKHFENGIVYREVRDTISADVQRYNNKYPNTTGELIGSKDLAKVYRAFVEMLLELDNKVDAEEQNNIRLIYSEFAGSRDPWLVDLSVSGLMDSLYLNKRDETAQILLMDYEELTYPKDFDVMMTFINVFGDLKVSGAKEILEKNLQSKNMEIVKNSNIALSKINNRTFKQENIYNTDLDWKFINNMRSKTAAIYTNKGFIKLEFFPDIAPFTVQKFLKLAEAGAYDNVPWHRVVPNFVVQGGDITEGNYKGNRHVMRSEFSHLTFERGILGVASSGKDTEESQFFIMHSHHPHLDGKYTIFGRVKEGMDIVDEIQVGEMIEKILITK